MRNASQTERARHLLHTRMRAIVVGLLFLAILPCCFHDPCPYARECQEGHRTVRSTTAMVADCSKCDCVFRGRFARQCASPSRSCPHIAPSMSDGSRSFFDFHTGDRCSFERYCCITAVARLLLHHFVRLLFAAHKFL